MHTYRFAVENLLGALTTIMENSDSPRTRAYARSILQITKWYLQGAEGGPIQWLNTNTLWDSRIAPAGENGLIVQGCKFCHASILVAPSYPHPDQHKAGGVPCEVWTDDHQWDFVGFVCLPCVDVAVTEKRAELHRGFGDRRSLLLRERVHPNSVRRTGTGE